MKYIYKLTMQIFFMLVLVSCVSNNSTQEKSQERLKEIQETRSIQETSKTETSPLSKEDAYSKLASYDKIYNWIHMYVIDKNYEPAKEFKYNNPEVKITPHMIKLNSEIYEVVDYEAFYVKNQTYNESITFKFKIIGGEATFFHNYGKSEYLFTIKFKNSNRMAYCSNEKQYSFIIENL